MCYDLFQEVRHQMDNQNVPCLHCRWSKQVGSKLMCMHNPPVTIMGYKGPEFVYPTVQDGFTCHLGEPKQPGSFNQLNQSVDELEGRINVRDYRHLTQAHAKC